MIVWVCNLDSLRLSYTAISSTFRFKTRLSDKHYGTYIDQSSFTNISIKGAELGVTGAGTIPHPVAIAIGIGWEIGRAITNISAY